MGRVLVPKLVENLSDPTEGNVTALYALTQGKVTSFVIKRPLGCTMARLSASLPRVVF